MARRGVSLDMAQPEGSPILEKQVARLNIGHFRHLLRGETDPGRLVMITRLLANERQTLDRLMAVQARKATS